MRILPADRQSFVDLETLTGFNTTAAQNALVGIIAVERVGAVDFVRLGFEWETLVLDGQHLGGVVNDAVAVVVVADGAIKEVIAQNAIERFRSRQLRPLRRDLHGHVVRNRSRTGAHQLSIEFHKAGVASLDRAELRVIADVGKLNSGAANRVDETLSFPGFVGGTINENRHLSEPAPLYQAAFSARHL